MVEKLRVRKRELLTKRLALLIQQWQAANDQRDATLNNADRVPLDKQIAALEEEIEKTEMRLAEMDSQSGDPNRQHLDFEDKIHRIDFGEVKDLIKDVVSHAKRDGAASLFLLQNSIAMGGKWCLDAIRHELTQNTLDFKPYPIGFTGAPACWPGSTRCRRGAGRGLRPRSSRTSRRCFR